MTEQASVGQALEIEQVGQLRGAVIPVTPFQQNCTILWDDASMQAVVVEPA
jgi:hypothetical protein